MKLSTALKVIEDFSQIDYQSASIGEISELMNPLLDKFRIAAVRYKKGIYINRMRKCDQPTQIRDITYPPAQLTSIGRANEEGKPLFYGSIGKNVPLFELDPSIGDKIAISTWKTKEDIILTQIGFTKDTAVQLQTVRNFEERSFVQSMKAFRETNQAIYNFFAQCFTQKIPPEESHRYKLTVAIANWLISGSEFAGILYPTIRMSGNADNVALKPEVVDRAL